MKTVSWLMAALLMLAPAAQTFAAGQRVRETPPAKIKVQVAKIGIGEKARATVTTKDGAKLKGYIYRAGEDDFEIRDRKTNAATTIRYADAAKVDGNRGHSVARIVLIAVAAGTAIVLASVYFAIKRNG